jgi:hypothetical protein
VVKLLLGYYTEIRSRNEIVRKYDCWKQEGKLWRMQKLQKKLETFCKEIWNYGTCIIILVQLKMYKRIRLFDLIIMKKQQKLVSLPNLY